MLDPDRTRPTLAVLAFGLLAAGPAHGLEVRKEWGPVAAPERGVFVEVVPRQDGSVLAATGDAVFSLDPGGQVALRGKGDRAILDPDGKAFGLWQKESFQVFEAGGQRLGSLPAPLLSTFKLAPGGELVYAPRVAVRREFGWVENVRLLRPDGTPTADFPAAGLEISRLPKDRIVYTLPGSLVARALDGKELWSAKLQVHKFESAGERTILVRRYVPGEVIHLDKGQRVAEAKVEGVVWNLAISPDGRSSAATTRTILYLFRDGRQTGMARLPVSYANSLDVSDRGEALVGGQDPRAKGRILLYRSNGTPLWQGEGATDRGAYRPGVRFAPGGDRFLVLEERGLSSFEILRSQP
jgi:hypothetical protein